MTAHIKDAFSVAKAVPDDIAGMMACVRDAQKYLSRCEVDQWQNGYPNESVILRDIELGNAYVAKSPNGRLAGIMALVFGDEPSYAHIYGGEWRFSGEKYATLHRLAVRAEFRGGGLAFALLRAAQSEAAIRGVSVLRADTHRDNMTMRGFLQKHGFERRGVIYLADGSERLAFDTRINMSTDEKVDYD